jgi:hypothetical protein
MPKLAKQKRFFVRVEKDACAFVPGGETFEVIERAEGDCKESVCYGGFLRKVIAEGVAGMLNANPEMSWKEIQQEFAGERKLCI